MITLNEDGTMATIVFPWPTNDTGGRVLTAMRSAAMDALAAAGHNTTTVPAYQDLRRTEAGFEFVFTCPIIRPEVTP